MHAHADEVLRSRFLIERHQVLGIKTLRLPGGDHVLEADLRRVPVFLEVVLVLLVSLDVHVPGVPVAIFGRGLRAPVGPDAELGVAEPFRRAVGLQRFASPRERAWGDRGHRLPQNRSSL